MQFIESICFFYLFKGESRLKDLHKLLISSLAKPEGDLPDLEEKSQREPSNNVSFIKETKNLLNNRTPPPATTTSKLTQETLLPLLDSFLTRLEGPGFNDRNNIRANDSMSTQRFKNDKEPSTPSSKQSTTDEIIKEAVKSQVLIKSTILIVRFD